MAGGLQASRWLLLASHYIRSGKKTRWSQEDWGDRAGEERRKERGRERYFKLLCCTTSFSFTVEQEKQQHEGEIQVRTIQRCTYTNIVTKFFLLWPEKIPDCCMKWEKKCWVCHNPFLLALPSLSLYALPSQFVVKRGKRMNGKMAGSLYGTLCTTSFRRSNWIIEAWIWPPFCTYSGAHTHTHKLSPCACVNCQLETTTSRQTWIEQKKTLCFVQRFQSVKSKYVCKG